MSAERINYVNRDGLFRYDESTNTEIALFTHRSINNLTKTTPSPFLILTADVIRQVKCSSLLKKQTNKKTDKPLCKNNNK